MQMQYMQEYNLHKLDLNGFSTPRDLIINHLEIGLNLSKDEYKITSESNTMIYEKRPSVVYRYVIEFETEKEESILIFNKIINNYAR